MANQTQALLDLIGSIESKNNYNAVAKSKPKDLSGYTISQLRAYQDSNGNKAVGKYQFVPGTIDGLIKSGVISKTDQFTPEVQDKMAIALIRARGLDAYLSGKISAEQFANKLAQEWAALPMATGANAGLSYYQGQYGNKALTDVNSVLTALNTIRSAPAAAAPDNALAAIVAATYGGKGGADTTFPALSAYTGGAAGNHNFSPLPAPAPLVAPFQAPTLAQTRAEQAMARNPFSTGSVIGNDTLYDAQNDPRYPVSGGFNRGTWANPAPQSIPIQTPASRIPASGALTLREYNSIFTGPQPVGATGNINPVSVSPQTRPQSYDQQVLSGYRDIFTGPAPVGSTGNYYGAQSHTSDSGLTSRKVTTYKIDGNGNPIWPAPTTPSYMQSNGWVNPAPAAPSAGAHSLGGSTSVAAVKTLNPAYQEWLKTYGAETGTGANTLMTGPGTFQDLQNFANTGVLPPTSSGIAPPAPPKYIYSGGGHSIGGNNRGSGLTYSPPPVQTTQIRTGKTVAVGTKTAHGGTVNKDGSISYNWGTVPGKPSSGDTSAPTGKWWIDNSNGYTV